MNFRYINKYPTQAAYDAANKFYPNTSYIEATDEIVYQETDPTLIVAKFTTTSANQSVKITYNQELFSSIKIEGESQTIGTGALNYTFATAGEHEVKLKSVDTTIGGYAFYGCSALTSVVIPNTMTSINQYAFRDCTGLTSVTIPNTMTLINQYAFYNCSSLTGSLTIPDTVTFIGPWAFQICTGLTSVTIGNSVTNISNQTFRGCTGLTSVTIGSGVTDIYTGAFYGCSSLMSLTCLATTPPTPSNMFQSGAIPATCDIYVPAASVSAYKTAWSDREAYIQAIPS